ncbi:glycoside hydrolase domain-containing protein [Streptomyces sp. NRRL F-5630]|uniref:glycoside hydrolase domain-containing protein n=1 Tax=Streptomyces sp. NRRL F-5630 TaxID=1463864 RepID=UPI003EBCFE65
MRRLAGTVPLRLGVLGSVLLLLLGGASPASGGEGPAWSARGVATYTGRAFDTCTAPPLATMRAWRDSPYRAVGVYVGGRARACPQPELDAGWLREVRGLDWSVLPLYVGSQAPCVEAENKKKYRLGGDPAGTGTEEGRDAVRSARALGITPRSPLYLDVEAYDERRAECARVVLSFVRAWDRAVTAEGYVPGFYSSADSGVAQLERERRAGTANLPEVMWFAHWTGKGSLDAPGVLAPQAWTPQRRIHQYKGNVKETYGGKTLSIDRNQVDAPVASLG